MPLIETETHATCRIIRFARPETRNPLSRAVLDALEGELDAVERDRDIERVIFTGAADVFASGADLREIADVSDVDAAEFARRGQRVMAQIVGLPQLTIAAVNGYCFGGLDLALSCDIRIASPNATFAHPGSGLGIITGWGGTQRLPRLVGTANALEMFFTASPINAGRAHAIGLIDGMCDDPEQTAISFVQPSD